MNARLQKEGSKIVVALLKVGSWFSDVESKTYE